MAGDWIKVEVATSYKPEVLRIAELLGVSRRECMGILVDFWAWLDANAHSESVRNLSRKSLDDVLHCPGLAATLEAVGWVEWDDKTASARITNYDRHNGNSAKRRAYDQKRQSEKRRNLSASNADKKRTREEKRREEITTTSKAKTDTKAVAASPLPGWLDKPTWDRFLEARSAMKARATPHAQALLLRDLAKLREAGQDPTAVLEQSISRSWRGLFAVKGDAPIRKTDQRTAFADSIIGAVTHGQATDSADPRDISGEAERVA